jgi:hypothetical protein
MRVFTAQIDSNEEYALKKPPSFLKRLGFTYNKCRVSHNFWDLADFDAMQQEQTFQP